MKKIIMLVILGALAWHGYRQGAKEDSPAGAAMRENITIDELRASSGSHFACDGRTHCSQMKSCEEAKYFLQNCPGVKMDGDNDGIPCENQWCS